MNWNPFNLAFNKGSLQARAGLAVTQWRLSAGHGRRHRTLTRAAKTLTAGVGYAALVEPRHLEISQHEIPVVGLPRSLDGYRIVHLTDIHYKLGSGKRFVQNVVEKANSLDPDLVALTGDFITHNPANLARCVQVLKGLRASDGLFATRGNHDHVVNRETMRRQLESAGIVLLENESVPISAQRSRSDGIKFFAGSDRFNLAAVGDLWKGPCDPGKALRGLDPGEPCVLLSHNPQAAELLVPSQRVDLMLSGHTHGGQVRPLNRTVAAFADGSRRYTSGFVHLPKTKVFISRGVGTAAIHVRWNCRPEIALLVLRSVPNDGN